jgi:hypothetical protein
MHFIPGKNFPHNIYKISSSPKRTKINLLMALLMDLCAGNVIHFSGSPTNKFLDDWQDIF